MRNIHVYQHRSAAAALLLAGSLCLPGFGHTATAVTVPGCDTLERLAGQVNAADQVPINRWAEAPRRRSGLTLTSALTRPEFVAAVGAEVVDWSPQDLSAMANAINGCIKSASQARRMDAQKQLIELRRVLQFHFNQPGNAVRRAREAVATNLSALKALPDGPDKLKLFALLARLPTLGAQAAITEVRQPIERERGPGATPGRLVAAHLVQLPQAEADTHLNTIVETRDALLEVVLAEWSSRLDTAPASITGLAEIATVESELSSEIAGFAPAARIQSLRSAAATARDRIWPGVEHTIAELPEDASGLAELDTTIASGAYRQLSRADRQRLDTLVANRQQAMAEAAVQEPIDRLSAFPEGLDGVRELVAFARETRRTLGRQSGGRSARQAFENAYAEIHPARVAAAESEFSDLLEDLPDTRESVARIRALLKEADAPARSDFYRLGLARAKDIVLSVERSERRTQCEAAMPGLRLDEDDAAQPVLGLGGETPALGDLLCDIALAGSQVHSYDGPGFFDDDHEIGITGRDGIYRTYTLNPAPVGPDREALVGVRIADPTQERNLGVEEWRQALAGMLPDTPAGRDARCSQLMNTPEGALSANDKMAAMNCVLGSLLGP